MVDALTRAWLGLNGTPSGRRLAILLEAAWYLLLLWLIWEYRDAPRRAFPYLR